jgi:hypothetical protein
LEFTVQDSTRFSLSHLDRLLSDQPDTPARETTRFCLQTAFDSIRTSDAPLGTTNTTFEGLDPLIQWKPPASGEILASESRIAVHRDRLIGASEQHRDQGCHDRAIDHFMVAALVYAEVVATLVQFHRQSFGIFSWAVRSPSRGLSLLGLAASVSWFAVKWLVVVGAALWAYPDAPLITALIAVAVIVVQATALMRRVHRERLAASMLNVYGYATTGRVDWAALRSALDAATALGARFDAVVHGLVARNLP